MQHTDTLNRCCGGTKSTGTKASKPKGGATKPKTGTKGTRPRGW